jgi:hypothetical protein
MRDEKDPGTIEMPLRKKPGPKPKNGRPMTPAQRAAKYRRERRLLALSARGKGPLSKLTDVQLVDALRQALALGHRARVLTITDILRDRYDTSKA